MKRNIILNRHFNKRMEERIGIKINKKCRNYILNLIWNGKAELLERQSNAIGLYIIRLTDNNIEEINKLLNIEVKRFDKKELYPVYNKVRKKLVTILTPEQAKIHILSTVNKTNNGDIIWD
jgi:hypothetical protein